VEVERSSGFEITRFTNPGGEDVFRLSGTLNSERIRKIFKKRADAVAQRQKLKARYSIATACNPRYAASSDCKPISVAFNLAKTASQK